MPDLSKMMIACGLVLAGLGGGWLIASRAPMTNPAPEDSAPTTHGEWVRYANAAGDSIRAYVAYPERQGKAPALIVIHEIFGLTDWEQGVVDDYAAKGYVAIAPDLLSSRFGSTSVLGDTARQAVGRLSSEGVLADLDATWDYINAQPATDTGNIGAIGFCWGGGTVWNLAAHNPRLRAAVVCYGPLADTALLNSVEAPVLGVYGENDGRVTNALPDIVRKMNELGKSFVADSYAGTGHGFLKPGRNGHGTAEAVRAQADIDAFLKRQLERR
ncbi:MAG TPA: dienelactone hydrolase family protein [Gemmatimonadales bacterium]|nr:dienelactone hydrolase family protein [Gemmatimonadales bacterium]